MYTRLSAYQLAVLHGIYPKPHACWDFGFVVWIDDGPVFELTGCRSEDIARFRCRCGGYGFITRSNIEEIVDPEATMRPWVKEQRDRM